MIVRIKMLVALLATVAAPHAACAQADPYRITSAEKAACAADAIRLCAGTYPDESKLMACMVVNKASLTDGCLVVFNAGLKRRHLVAR